MRLFEENEKLIKELEKQIDILNITELEENIKANAFDEAYYCEKRYKVHERIFYLKNRIKAVNQKFLHEEEMFRNPFFYVDNMDNTLCKIEYMDAPLNRKKYLVQDFYDKLYKKYGIQFDKFMLLGLKPNANGRLLKCEYLDELERRQAIILDEYLKICLLYDQIEALIDCIKIVQFNYIED